MEQSRQREKGKQGVDNNHELSLEQLANVAGGTGVDSTVVQGTPVVSQTSGAGAGKVKFNDF